MDGFPIGDFDMSFGGIPVNVGREEKFDMGFSEEYLDDDLLQNNPRAPELISSDFDEPADMFDIEDQFRNDLSNQMAFRQPKIPKLTESLSDIMGIGRRKKQEIKVTIKKIPKTDEEADELEEETVEIVEKRKRRGQRFSNRFEDIRFEQLNAGGNPLTGFEEQNFQRGRSFRGEE